MPFDLTKFLDQLQAMLDELRASIVESPAADTGSVVEPAAPEPDPLPDQAAPDAGAPVAHANPCSVCDAAALAPQHLRDTDGSWPPAAELVQHDYQPSEA